MKKGYIRLLIVCFLLISFFTLNGIFEILSTYTLIFGLFIVAVGLYYYLGYEKDNHRFKKETYLNIIIFSGGYYIITYLLGLLLGFNRTVLKLDVLSIFKNIIPIVLIIIISEFIRYIIVTKGSRYRIIQILVVITFSIFDMLLNINSFKNLSLEVVVTVLFPAISTNIMLTYLANKVGYRPAILYRALFELPKFILPIFPNFGIYVGAVINILSPGVLIGIVYYSFLKTKFTIKKNQKMTVSYLVAFSILFLIFGLTSGWFKYYAITVGSGSMKPNIKVGDVAIVKKLNDEEISQIQEGEVLVFNHDEKIVIHRIMGIMKINNIYYFHTKGDNNEMWDGYPINEKDVIGTATLRIPFIGYPTIWLNRLVK